MKHSVQLFLITSLCIATNMSFTMELEQPQKKDLQIKKANILTAITNITKPQHAYYISNNLIIVAGENGCSIIDPIHNKEVKRISDAQNPYLAVHSHQKQFAVAYDNSINIYDTDTYSLAYSIPVDGPSGKKMGTYDTIRSITFSPHDTSILSTKDHYTFYNGHPHLMSHSIEQYNDITKNNFQIPYRGNMYPPIISCNPTDNEICIIYALDICFYNLNILDIPKKGNHTGIYIQNFHQYTPDGKLFATSNHNTITIGDEKYQKGIASFGSSPKLTFQHTGDHHKFFKNILFYSNSVLATLVTIYPKKQDGPTKGSWQHPSHSHLCYWDIHRKEIIHEDDLPGMADVFSFNRHKTKVIIVLQDKCIIIPVDFDVIYKDITKEEMTYLLFALKNIDLKPEIIEIPNDIALFITQKILETYKRD